MSRRSAYDDEPRYLDWGKWLRIAVTAASALLLLALLLLAATTENQSRPDDAPANPTAALETNVSVSPSATTTATPTATLTATATPVTLGAASPSPSLPISALVQTAACTRLSCSEFYSRAELDSYLLQCPDDYGKFDRDGDSRTCWNAADW